MLSREEAQAAISDVCKKRGLKYTLDFEYEQDGRSKIRIAYVKPENNLDYIHLLIAGKRWESDAVDVIEEEVLLEIWQEGNKWEHKIARTKTLPTGDSVIGDLQADVTDALAETDWQNAYRMIPDKGDDRRLVQMWNKGSDRNAISERLECSALTVTKRITLLRKAYPKYVMFHAQRVRLGVRPSVMLR